MKERRLIPAHAVHTDDSRLTDEENEALIAEIDSDASIRLKKLRARPRALPNVVSLLFHNLRWPFERLCFAASLASYVPAGF